MGGSATAEGQGTLGHCNPLSCFVLYRRLGDFLLCECLLTLNANPFSAAATLWLVKYIPKKSNLTNTHLDYFIYIPSHSLCLNKHSPTAITITLPTPFFSLKDAPLPLSFIFMQSHSARTCCLSALRKRYLFNTQSCSPIIT